MPKVSIVIPVYKVEKYIAKCAKSLFEQTLDDIEYIFVNDCTSDKSIGVLLEVLQQYPNRKPQVKIIHHKKNLGAAIARKNGILAATGKYIIHCDSDDWVVPQMYQLLYEKAKEEHLDIVISSYIEKRTDSTIIHEQNLGDHPCSKIISNPILCSLWNKLVRRDIIDWNNVLYPNHHMMEDAVLCAQIFFFAKKVGYVNQPLYYYRINDDSICHVSTENGDLKRWHEAYENVKIIERFLKQQQHDKQYKNELIQSKANVRGFLMPQLQKSNKHYKLWYNTFPELNRQYLFAQGPSISIKVIFLLTLLRIYPYMHKILKALK